MGAEILLVPPVAFVIYLGLVMLLSRIGKRLARTPAGTETALETYASGEAAPEGQSAPGYRPFFVIALFFAVLHLGVLVLGSSDLSGSAAVYLLGLAAALIALILG
jgi:hydrogenase/urease accessory protein HupE